MGTHCNGPAEVEGIEVPLTQVLVENPDMMANYPPAYESYKATGELPYLFKILSVAKALSIQAHPDKALAERIHAEHPTIYKDPNHKPEMALAITEMEALCQFRDPAEILEFLRSEPEFASMCGETERAAFEADKSIATLKDLFRSFMHQDEVAVKTNLDALLERYKSIDDKSDIQALVVRLNDQFPGDIGCFCPFLLNYVKLQVKLLPICTLVRLKQLCMLFVAAR
jgi:mannose-6-phosphate isomerase